jgi:hypothetical protein
VPGFKKPFKAVPLKPKRLKGLEELDKPLWSPPEKREPISWRIAGVGLFIGICAGLALIIGTS